MNPAMEMTLDEAVGEVLNQLTGLDMHYIPELDRYRSIVRHLNRALRANALESEWSCYTDTVVIGEIVDGQRAYAIPNNIRLRTISDDAVRLINAEDDPIVWAYFLPRDALHKYRTKGGLWASVTRETLTFSRPLRVPEGAPRLRIQVPVMREPRKLIMPAARESIEDLIHQGPLEPYIEQKRNFHIPEVVEEWVVEPGDIPYILDDPETSLRRSMGDTTFIKNQKIDFFYPDMIVAKAAFFYAQSDPVMQPRVQTLEGQYKDLMYQVIERDTAITDTPYMNEFILPVENGIVPQDSPYGHRHPHSDWRN